MNKFEQRILKTTNRKTQEIDFVEMFSAKKTQSNNIFIACKDKYDINYLRILTDINSKYDDVDILRIDIELSEKLGLKIGSYFIFVFSKGFLYYSDITNYMINTINYPIETEEHDLYSIKHIKMYDSHGFFIGYHIMVPKLNRTTFFKNIISKCITSYVYKTYSPTDQYAAELYKDILMEKIDLEININELKKEFIQLWNTSFSSIAMLKKQFGLRAPKTIKELNHLNSNTRLDNDFRENKSDVKSNYKIEDIRKFSTNSSNGRKVGIVFSAKMHFDNNTLSMSTISRYKYRIIKIIFDQLLEKDREAYIYQKTINFYKLIITGDYIETYFILDDPKYEYEQQEIISSCLNELNSFQAVIVKDFKLKEFNKNFYKKVKITEKDLLDYIFENEKFNSKVVKESLYKFRIKNHYDDFIDFTTYSSTGNVVIDISGIGDYYIDYSEENVNKKTIYSGYNNSYKTTILEINNLVFTITEEVCFSKWHYISYQYIEEAFFEFVDKKLRKINPFILKADIDSLLGSNNYLCSKYLTGGVKENIKNEIEKYYNSIWTDESVKFDDFDSVMKNKIEQLFNEINLDEIINIIKNNSYLLISGLVTSKPKLKKDRTIDNRTKYPNVFYVDASLNSKAGSVSLDTLKKFIIKRKKYIVSYLYNFLFDNCPEANDIKDFITIDSMVITNDYRLHVVFGIKEDKIQEVS